MIVIAILIIAFLVAFFVIRYGKIGKAWKEEQARKEREAKAAAANEAWLKQYKATEAQREKDREEEDAWLESLDENMQPREDLPETEEEDAE